MSKMYKIKLTQISVESLGKIDKNAKKQIVNKIDDLRSEPLMLGKALKGPLKEYRSIRAAGQRYRIIYRVFEKEVIVIIVAVGIRKDGDKKGIYELMKKFIRTGLLNEE